MLELYWPSSSCSSYLVPALLPFDRIDPGGERRCRTGGAPGVAPVGFRRSLICHGLNKDSSKLDYEFTERISDSQKQKIVKRLDEFELVSDFRNFREDPIVEKLRTQLGEIHPIPSPPINGRVVGLFIVFFFVGVIFDKLWTSRKRDKLTRDSRSGIWPQVPTSLSLFLEKDLQRKESAEWVNMVVGKLWKVYPSGIENWIIGLLQPVIDDLKKPSYVQRVEIKQFSMGEEPLSVRNVERRTSRRPNDLQYHIGLRYTGGARMLLLLSLKFSIIPIVVPVGVRHFDIDGELWVKLRLIPTEPWIGAVSWAFVSLPKIKFELAAFRLFNLMGKTDPYVVLTLGDQVIRSKKNSQTTVIGPPGAPIWNQDFHILVVDPREQRLRVQVKDSFGFTDFTIGTGEVELASLKDTVPTDKVITLRSGWGILNKGSSGEILLRLTYKAYVEDEEDDSKVKQLESDMSDDESLNYEEAEGFYGPMDRNSSDGTERESFMNVLAALIVSEEFQGIMAFDSGNVESSEEATKTDTNMLRSSGLGSKADATDPESSLNDSGD